MHMHMHMYMYSNQDHDSNFRTSTRDSQWSGLKRALASAHAPKVRLDVRPEREQSGDASRDNQCPSNGVPAMPREAVGVALHVRFDVHRGRGSHPAQE